MTRVAALAGTVTACVVLAGAAAAPAQAHTTLEHAAPGPGDNAAPGLGVVALTFSSLQAGSGQVTVTGPADEPVPTGQPVPAGEDEDTLCVAVEPLAAGVHAVQYQARSRDGHPVSGRYLFEVVPGGPVRDVPEPCQAVALPTVAASPPPGARPDPRAAASPGAGVVAAAAGLTVLVALLALGAWLWRVRRSPRQHSG